MIRSCADIINWIEILYKMVFERFSFIWKGAISIDHPGFFSKKVVSLLEVASVVMGDWEALKVKVLHSDDMKCKE